MQEFRDNAEVQATRPERFEIPGLALSNAEMAAFERLTQLGDRSNARDREQELFGGGFSFAHSGWDVLYGSAENKSEQVYLSSNITPELPRMVQASPLSKDQKLPESVTAQNYDYNGGLPTLVPSPEQLGLKPVIDLATQSTALELEQKWNPLRGKIDAELGAIPESAWHHAYVSFPQFKEAGLTEVQAIEVMKAIVRNELYNYDLSDKLDDDHARKAGKPLDLPKRSGSDATLGDSQLSVNAVIKRAEEYPEQIGQFKGHEVEALLNPKNAPLLVAATLVHNLEMYKRHGVPITQQTLGYSYNPPGGRMLPGAEDLKSEHARNVMHQLQIIQGLIEPKAGER